MNAGAATALVLIAIGPLLLIAPFAQSLRGRKGYRPFVDTLAIIAITSWAVAVALGVLATQAQSDWGVFGGMSLVLGFVSYVLAGAVFVTNFMLPGPTKTRGEPNQPPEPMRAKGPHGSS
jgi:hypothetical protein